MELWYANNSETGFNLKKSFLTEFSKKKRVNAVLLINLIQFFFQCPIYPLVGQLIIVKNRNAFLKRNMIWDSPLYVMTLFY